MSTLDTHNPWAPGSTTAASTSTTVSPTRKTGGASLSPTKDRTVIVIDDSDADNGDSDSGSDTEQSAVEAHLLRDSGSNKGSSMGSREMNGNMKMDIDHITGYTDSRDAKTPTTTHEPPTSPSVSPRGWSSQQVDFSYFLFLRVMLMLNDSGLSVKRRTTYSNSATNYFTCASPTSWFSAGHSYPTVYDPTSCPWVCSATHTFPTECSSTNCNANPASETQGIT